MSDSDGEYIDIDDAGPSVQTNGYGTRGRAGKLQSRICFTEGLTSFSVWEGRYPSSVIDFITMTWRPTLKPRGIRQKIA